MSSSYLYISEVQRKVGTEKAYPQKIKSLMEQNECLHAYRQGVVGSFIEQEKPTFYPEELIANRKRRLSYSCEKLGIDHTKGEVLSVSIMMKEFDDTLANVQDVECPKRAKFTSSRRKVFLMLRGYWQPLFKKKYPIVEGM